jgi:hypothetical protein
LDLQFLLVLKYLRSFWPSPMPTGWGLAAGVAANRRTGWTGTVANLIQLCAFEFCRRSYLSLESVAYSPSRNEADTLRGLR